MTTVTAGSVGSFTLTSSQIITISPDSGEYAVFDVLRDGVIVASGRARAGQTFGPYETGDVFTLTAQRGDVDYTVSSAPESAGTLTASQVAAVDALLTGSGPLLPGQALILKAFTGRSQLTGGSPATKAALMEVPIPDGSFSDLSVRMDIEASFNYTNNANTKEWGIAIGASSATGGTVGASVDLRTLSATTTASIADKIVVQRNAETPTRLYLVIPNNSRIFGVNATIGATVGVLPVRPLIRRHRPVAWVWGRLASVADQVSLEHLFVQLQRGVA